MKSHPLVFPLLGLALSGLAACHGLAGEARPSGLRAEVFKSTGALQCEPDSGIAIHEMQRDLAEAGIPVLDGSCGVMTGVQFITVCGAEYGSLNVFTIPAADLAEAQALGFSATRSLPGASDGRGWQPVACPEERES